MKLEAGKQYISRERRKYTVRQQYGEGYSFAGWPDDEDWRACRFYREDGTHAYGMYRLDLVEEYKPVQPLDAPKVNVGTVELTVESTQALGAIVILTEATEKLTEALQAATTAMQNFKQAANKFNE